MKDVQRGFGCGQTRSVLSTEVVLWTWFLDHAKILRKHNVLLIFEVLYLVPFF